MDKAFEQKLSQMQDIIDVKDLIAWDLSWLYLIVFVFLGLLFFFISKKIYRKILDRKNLMQLERTPQERALFRLNILLDKHLIEKQRVSRFYFEYSEIFRSFLEEEWNLKALEATEKELKALILDTNLNLDLKASAKKMIELCELAKFAKFVPSQEDINRSIRQLRDFIDLANKVPEPVQSPPEGNV